MILDSFDSIFYTAIFLLPGFVMHSIIERLNPPQKHTEWVSFLKYILYSIINCATWSWIYNIVIRDQCIESALKWIILFCISVLGSSILGIIIAFIRQKEIINRVLAKCGIKYIHPTPTAWDYYFSKQESSFVIVTLSDGTIIRGWFSGNSFASSDAEQRDIYIEMAYTEGWEQDIESKGIYIPSDQIKYIEFKGAGKNEYRQAESK